MEIKSLQHPLVKHLVKLSHNRDYREEHGTALLEGFKMVEEVCRTHSPKCVVVTDESLIPSGIKPQQVIVAPEELLKKITGTPQPEGIVAEVEMAKPASLKGMKRILALDGVGDPGNLGTLLRTALSLGWEGVFLLNDCCDPYNDKALRAAKGATFRIPMRKGHWEELKELKLPLFAADLDGHPIGKVALPQSLALILGSEAHGLSLQAKKESQTVTIPQKGKMDSLNVAVAGGILMYLMARSE